jgi:hypothetical protein
MLFILELQWTRQAPFTKCLHSFTKWSLDNCYPLNNFCGQCEQEQLSVATGESFDGMCLAAKPVTGCVTQPGPFCYGSSAPLEYSRSD